MRMRQLFMVQSIDFDASWKYPMLVGVLLVLTTIAIVLVPQIPAVLVATGILTVGTGLVGSAWEMRRFHNRTRRRTPSEIIDW